MLVLVARPLLQSALFGAWHRGDSHFSAYGLVVAVIMDPQWHQQKKNNTCTHSRTHAHKISLHFTSPCAGRGHDGFNVTPSFEATKTNNQAKLEATLGICHGWEVRACCVGRVTNSNHVEQGGWVAKLTTLSHTYKTCYATTSERTYDAQHDDIDKLHAK